MPDNLTPETRSKVMASIKGRDTKPELILWNLLDHRKFKRHPDISGNPDIGSKSRKIAIFVDGCFWHGCPRCYKLPSTRPEYWSSKLKRNKENDKKSNRELEYKGYIVLRFWEHDVIADPLGCSSRILEVLK